MIGWVWHSTTAFQGREAPPEGRITTSNPCVLGCSSAGAVGAELPRAGAHCPHPPESCDCRKPLPGLFLRAARDHDLDLERSHYVGDRLRDIQPGLELGGRGYLVHAGAGDEAGPLPPTGEVVPDLAAAVDRVLERLR